MSSRDVLVAAGLAEPEKALAAFIQRQRWFAGRDRRLVDVEVEDAGVVAEGDPALVEAIVRVNYADGPVERYHVPLSVRGGVGPIDVGDRAIAEGRRDGVAVQVVDALVDGDAAVGFWRLVAGSEAVSLTVSEVCGRNIGGVTPAAPEELLPLAREQSNSLMLRGESELLKCFRRVEEESSPELEMLEALAAAGFTNIARPLGAIEHRRPGGVSVLALLQPYLHNATEGWALAQTSLRDLYAEAEERNFDTALDIRALVDDQGSDFSPEAARLGAVTAEMHLALASDALPEAMRARAAGPDTVRSWAAEMVADLEAVLPGLRREVPGVAGAEAAIRARLAALAALEDGGLATRVHGDYHLGQVVRVDAGWTILDFEGEPTRPVEARRRLSSPLRDVAGMLRSFEYAAAAALGQRSIDAGDEGEQLLPYADAWAGVNREAFWDAYVATAGEGGLLPGGEAARILLDAFETQKALYEADYELKHRPDWLWIPARFLAQSR